MSQFHLNFPNQLLPGNPQMKAFSKEWHNNYFRLDLTIVALGYLPLEHLHAAPRKVTYLFVRFSLNVRGVQSPQAFWKDTREFEKREIIIHTNKHTQFVNLFTICDKVYVVFMWLYRGKMPDWWAYLQIDCFGVWRLKTEWITKNTRKCLWWKFT